MKKTFICNESDFNLWKSTIEKRYFKNFGLIHFEVERPKEYPVIAVSTEYEVQVDAHCMPNTLCKAILVYPSDFSVVKK